MNVSMTSLAESPIAAAGAAAPPANATIGATGTRSIGFGDAVASALAAQAQTAPTRQDVRAASMLVASRAATGSLAITSAALSLPAPAPDAVSPVGSALPDAPQASKSRLMPGVADNTSAMVSPATRAAALLLPAAAASLDHIAVSAAGGIDNDEQPPAASDLLAAETNTPAMNLDTHVVADAPVAGAALKARMAQSVFPLPDRVIAPVADIASSHDQAPVLSAQTPAAAAQPGPVPARLVATPDEVPAPRPQFADGQSPQVARPDALAPNTSKPNLTRPVAPRAELAETTAVPAPTGASALAGQPAFIASLPPAGRTVASETPAKARVDKNGQDEPALPAIDTLAAAALPYPPILPSHVPPEPPASIAAPDPAATTPTPVALHSSAPRQTAPLSALADGAVEGFIPADPAVAGVPLIKDDTATTESRPTNAAVPPKSAPDPARRQAPVLLSHDDIAAPASAVASFAPVTSAAPAEAKVPAAAAPALLATQPERLAQDLGLAIARQVSADGNELHIRLEPAELGRIDVRMSFDDRGNLRAIIGADSGIALDLLRRDSADLNRAMTDAGVRADSQSFRFDSRSDGRGNEGAPPRPMPQRFETSDMTAYPETPDPAQFKPLNWRNRVDILA